MDVLEISAAGLRALDDLRSPVLSVCLRLDPAVPTAAARGSQAEARFVEGARQLEHEIPEAERERLRLALPPLRTTVVARAESERQLRGLAAFRDEEGRVLVFALRRSPTQEVTASFGEQPMREPLLEASPGPSWGVLVVNRSHGAIFRGSELGLSEVCAVDDDVRGRHAQGGWSQARFQRAIEKEVNDHVGQACASLARLDRHLRFEHVAVVAPAGVWPLVESSMRRDLRERVAGHLAVDVPHPRPRELLEIVRPLMSKVHRGREVAALDRLEARLGEGERAAAGSDEVLGAIGEGKVETLLVDRGFEDDATERAVAGAIGQLAEVIFVDNAALDPVGHVAALLRY